MPATATKSRTRTAAKGNGKAAARAAAPEPKPERAARVSTSRSIWKGVISFGMVTIPVRLNPATSSRDISFHLLHDKCSSRLKQLRWCPVCEREVKWDEIVRGYEYGKDRYIRMSEHDFESLPIATKHTISLSAFVQQDEIDPIFFEKSYYLEPEPAGRKSYSLLLRALETKQRTAVAKIAIREKERLCALRPYRRALLLETLFYADEIRDVAPQADIDVSERELEMAYQLIEYLSEPFNPEEYRDEYREALMQVIEAKVHGEELVTAPAPSEPEVIDLMEALRKSLESAQRSKEEAEPQRKNGRRRAA